MAEDAFTLKLIAKELNNLLYGAKVNKINQPDREQVNFSLYNGQKTVDVTLSCNPSFCSAGLLFAVKDNPKAAFNFCMLLRKHLLGATVKGISADGKERIINFEFFAKNDFLESCEKTLAAEIMGKYSNLILIEKGKILGAAKTNLEEGKRSVFPGLTYSLPEKQDKCDFDDPEFISLLNGTKPDADFLFSKVRGISYSTAKQCEQLFFKGKCDSTGFIDFLKNFPTSSCPLNPCVLFENGSPADFLPFKPEFSYEKTEEYGTLLEAQQKYLNLKYSSGAFSALKRKLEQAIKHRETKYKKRLAAIEGKERDCADMQKNRLYGELLLSNLYMLKEGQSSAALQNYYDEEGGFVNISLDKNLTLKENATRYFKKFDKQKKTLAAIAPQRKETLNELNYIDSIKAELNEAGTISELKDIAAEIRLFEDDSAAKDKKKSKKGEKQPSLSPPLKYTIKGYTVRVGKNNMQNEELIKSSFGSDIWLHVKNYPSSHVLISAENKEVDKEVIVLAAEICAYFSKASNADKIEVDYTLRKFVKKPSGAKPGFVTYKNQTTLTVSPKRHENLLS